MLTYSEELALSDLLVARLQALNDLKESGSNTPNPQQQEAIDRGNSAATLLVEAYLPAIRALAASMLAKSSSPNVTFDDLVNEGVEDAMKRTMSFNCRGKDNRKGVRFASYASKSISKSMGRHMAKMSVPLTVNVDVIITSYDWNSTRNELRQKLGREPSVEQIEDASGINYDYVAAAPNSSHFHEVDAEESSDIEAEGQKTTFIQDYLKDEAELRMMFGEILNDEVVSELVSMFGLDRMYVRDRDEFALNQNISKRAATSRMAYLQSVITHPHYRLAFERVLKRMRGPVESD